MNAGAIEALEARERENEQRMAQGFGPLRMPTEWASRPRLSAAEQALFVEFLQFAQFCGDPRPQDAMAWFEMRGFARSEWPWLAELFAAMAHVARERVT